MAFTFNKISIDTVSNAFYRSKYKTRVLSLFCKFHHYFGVIIAIFRFVGKTALFKHKLKKNVKSCIIFFVSFP